MKEVNNTIPCSDTVFVIKSGEGALWVEPVTAWVLSVKQNDFSNKACCEPITPNGMWDDITEWKATYHQSHKLLVPFDGPIMHIESIEDACMFLSKKLGLKSMGPKPANISIELLGLPKRIENLLRAEGLDTIEKLIASGKTSVSSIPNIGKTAVAEIEKSLNDLFGYTLP